VKAQRGWHVVMLLAWIAGSGCTALREIPRSEYAGRAQRRPIQVLTREGLKYELDEARIEADTLVGYRRRDVQGPIDEFDTLRLPLDQVGTISARRIDWYRTGAIGALSMAAIVAVGLNRRVWSDSPPGTPDCRKPPCP
jgi:hypothetical protein